MSKKYLFKLEDKEDKEMSSVSSLSSSIVKKSGISFLDEF
jgi:hypothetical protein